MISYASTRSCQSSGSIGGISVPASARTYQSRISFSVLKAGLLVGSFIERVYSMSDKQHADARKHFIKNAKPVIVDWFNRQPISAEKFSFEQDDADDLSAALWDKVLSDIVGKP